MGDDPTYIPRTDILPGWGNVTYCDHETSELFHTICSYSALVTTPIDFLGVYFIIKKSPKEMASYKWFLLAHQFWSVLVSSLSVV